MFQIDVVLPYSEALLSENCKFYTDRIITLIYVFTKNIM